MAYVQIIEFSTNRLEEVEALMEEWMAKTAGKRTAERSLLASDRERADSFVQVVEFPSYEAAMTNSKLPETSAFAEKFAELCDGPPIFRDLDVLRTDEI